MREHAQVTTETEAVVWGLTTEGRYRGRCQKGFGADPTLLFQTDRALCPTCQEILLPRRAGGGGWPVAPIEA